MLCDIFVFVVGVARYGYLFVYVVFVLGVVFCRFKYFVCIYLYDESASRPPPRRFSRWERLCKSVRGGPSPGCRLATGGFSYWASSSPCRFKFFLFWRESADFYREFSIVFSSSFSIGNFL